MRLLSALLLMGQIFRALSTVSISGGGAGWQFSSGTDAAAMIDETIGDGNTTEVNTPATAALHSFEVLLAGWGNTTGRPKDHNTAALETHHRSPGGNTTFQLYLYEGATLRHTFAPFVVNSGTYLGFRQRIPPTVIDAIGDFTNLRIRYEITPAGAWRGCTSYGDVTMGDVAGEVTGSWSETFEGLSEMPRWWKQQLVGGAPKTVPTVSGGIISPAIGGLVLENHRMDFGRNGYARIRFATGYNPTNVMGGGFCRMHRIWHVTGGARDNWRYNNVNNTPSTQHEIELDGVLNIVYDTEAFASTSNMAAGDESETRVVDTLLTGLKNGTVILSSPVPNNVSGTSGVVFSVPTTSGPGIDRFQMGSLDAPFVPDYSNFPKALLRRAS